MTQPNALQRLQAYVPMILFGGAAVLWVVLATSKLAQWTGSMQLLGAAVMTVYILWLLLESKVSAAESGKGHTGKDHGTLEFYAIGRIVTVTAALALPSWWHELNAVAVTGLVLFVGGIVWRLVAIRTLGRFYSHRVRTVDAHRVVDTGPYRYLRHPAYTGMLISHLGFILFFFHPIALGLLLLLFVPSVVIRILVEEKMLFGIPGYARFAEGRARLLPFVW
ncbi:phosphatidylethanolamine N-methyltransferase family protein [soil metagenome]